MKRIFALLLALCLLFCGCAPAEDDTPIQDSTGESTEESTAESTEESTQESTEEIVLYRHPLTGAPLDAPFTGRPTAVVINNIKDALPQYGISKADMLYELSTEGGITRFLAVFSDLSNVAAIGPVRSARTYFNSISVGYDAPLVHCGGSQFALNGNYDKSGDTISNWQHINQFYNGSYFYRMTRPGEHDYFSKYAYEHKLFTTGEQLTAVLAKQGYNTANENGTDYGLTFDDEIVIQGQTANKIDMDFSSYKKTLMTYNTQTGLYDMAQYFKYKKDTLPLEDANDGTKIGFRNVLALHADWSQKSDGFYNRSFYELIGSGTGYFACGGKIVPIKWSRPSLREPFSYTLEDGTPITLGVGSTYVGILAHNKTVTYE